MALTREIKHQKTAAFAAGALASLAFAPVFALPLFLGAMVFVWFICDGLKTYKKTAAVGYFFGFGFFMCGFYWIANALLVDAKTFGVLYPVALLGLGGFFGVFMILPFLLWRYFESEGVWAKVSAFSASFVLMEYVRSFLLTGFAWNMLGTMFAFFPLAIQFASVVGAYGLSFIALVLTGAIYAFCKGLKKSGVVVFCAVSVFLIVFGLVRLEKYDNAPSDVKIRLVQPSIEQSVKWDEGALTDNFLEHIKMSQVQPLNGVQFVVWSETASPFDPRRSAFVRAQIRQAVPEGGYLLFGLIRYDEKRNQAYNSMSVIDEDGQTVAFYDKHHLVPFGEYVPLRRFLPNFVRPIANLFSDLSAGEKLKNIDVNGVFKFGALICYEIIFPDEVVNRKDKPSFLVVISNDAWYGKSFGPYQHLASAQLRAVEEGVTIVRSAGSGISALISPMGEIIDSLDLNKKGILDVFLPFNPTVPTIYALLGGKCVQLMMLAVLLALLTIKIVGLKHK
ncbi:MAG: apolipoprotein N-acyltransferase [Alphaproteobacteria bacterium]|nr:apolipoprotein N-acyltransferase [Alphaproteobacteria bacterium]